MIKAPPRAPGLTTLQMSSASLQKPMPSPQQGVREQDCCPPSEHQHNSSCGLLQTFLDAKKQREDTPIPTSAAAGPRGRNPKPKGDPHSCLPTENLNFHGTQGRLEPCPGHSWHRPGAQLEPGDPAPASPASPTHPRPRASHRAGHVLQTPQGTEPHWAMKRTKHEPGVRFQESPVPLRGQNPLLECQPEN